MLESYFSWIGSILDQLHSKADDFQYVCRAKIENNRYKNNYDEIVIREYQEASYKLLEFLNSFCHKNDTGYFLFADGLQGAIVYNDFIPGERTLEVGMLRNDYLRFESTYFDQLEQGLEASFILDAFHDQNRTIRKTMPLLQLRAPKEILTSTGQQLFTSDHIPALADPVFKISIFDAYPNDMDLRRTFFVRTRFANLFSDSASTAKDPSTKIGGKKLGSSISKCLPWKFVNNHAWKLAGRYKDKNQNYVGRLLHSRSKHISMDELLPLKMIPFGDTEAPCPNNSRVWIEEDLDAVNHNVKLLQEDALEILMEIDRICRENDLRYFICGGTMLGYVRHGGFIPWDDDIDVGMLRADYDRFIQIAKDQISQKFFLQTRESDPLIPYLFSKVRLNGSEYITDYNKERDFHKGICVDLFPFDRVPNDPHELMSFKAKVLKKSAEHNKVANHQLPFPAENEPPKSLSALFARLIYSIQRKRYWRKSLADTQAAYEEAVTVFNNEESFEYVASFVPTYTMVKLEDLLPMQDVDFAGVKVMAPAKPEVFLQMQYGDYMAMPMPHQQRGHGLLWWSDSRYDSRTGNK